MEENYRTACTRCSELQADIDALKEANAELRRTRRKEQETSVKRMLAKASVVGAGIGLCTFAGFVAYSLLARTRSPEPCVDSAEIILQGSASECSPGAEATTEILPGQITDRVLLRCRCPKPSASTAPPAASPSAPTAASGDEAGEGGGLPSP